jgi:hypothetical protein
MMKSFSTLSICLTFLLAAQTAWAERDATEDSAWHEDYLALDFVADIGSSLGRGMDLNSTIGEAMGFHVSAYVGFRLLEVESLELHQIETPYTYHLGTRTVYPLWGFLGVGADLRLLRGQSGKFVSGDQLEATDFLYVRTAGLVEIRGNWLAFRLDLGTAYVLHPGDCTNWHRNYYDPESACDSVVTGDSLSFTLSYILH